MALLCVLIGCTINDAVINYPITNYAPLSDTSKWSFFEVTTVNPKAKGFHGATFDGQYLYLMPGAPGGVAVRFDTTRSFTTAYWWSAVEFSAWILWSDGVSVSETGYWGAAFDGRYVYAAPYDKAGDFSGLVARYDTQDHLWPANNQAKWGLSWSTLDTTGLTAAAEGFHGAVFDGRYIYFVPFHNSMVTRYDTQGDFTGRSPAKDSAWSMFDISLVCGCPEGFAADLSSGVFDGRYVYFLPSGVEDAPGNIKKSPLLRFDTQAQTGFNNSDSWSVFDMAPLNPALLSVDAKPMEWGLLGAVFDGQFLYFVSSPSRIPMMRFDTTQKITDTTAWATFDTTTVNVPTSTTFGVGAFDGRYVYYVPSFDGILLRYDTQASFTSPGSWSTFDTTTLSSQALGFGAAVFDGEYLYLVPDTNGVMVRFDAKTPPSLPPGPAHGSFL